MSARTVLPEELFECRKCGACCQGYGGTYLEDADLQAIAAHVGMDVPTFIQRFCAVSANRYLLRQAPSGYCIFWDHLCTIHPVKPRMCKAWPFIPALLRDVQNWYAMARSCPGMRADATPQQVQAAVRRIVG